MKGKIILLSTAATLLVSTTTVFAAAGSPVAHNHNGRTHSHSLPAAGKNHSHGKKAASKAKKAPVAHSHDGRTHKHSLPVTGRNHTHGGVKKKAAPKASVNKKSGWSTVATSANKTFTIAFRNGTGVTSDDRQSITAVGQYSTKLYPGADKSTIEVLKLRVRRKDCSTGYGSIQKLTLAGKHIDSIDYVLEGDSMASAMADILCSLLLDN